MLVVEGGLQQVAAHPREREWLYIARGVTGLAVGPGGGPRGGGSAGRVRRCMRCTPTLYRDGKWGLFGGWVSDLSRGANGVLEGSGRLQ